MPHPAPMPSRASVREAAAVTLADPPPLDEWAAGRDEAMPFHTWTGRLKAAGWPTRTVTWMLPQVAHRGSRVGQRTGDAPQPVTVVPLTWLRALAARLGVPWRVACRGTGRYD